MAKRGERGKAYYMISAVSQKYDIHPQTLRLYEREGLLKPSRTEGNTRLYSEADLEQLETILTLTRDLGVNLAGGGVLLNLRRKIERVQGAGACPPRSQIRPPPLSRGTRRRRPLGRSARRSRNGRGTADEPVFLPSPFPPV